MLVRTFSSREGGALVVGDTLVVIHPVENGKIKVAVMAHPDDRVRFIKPDHLAREIPRLIAELEAEYAADGGPPLET